jgi:hypothetical protein
LIKRNRQQNRIALIAIFFITAAAYLTQPVRAAEEPTSNTNPSIGTTIANDYGNFYSKDRLIRLGIAFGLGGIAANTNIDMSIRNWYQDNVRSEQTNSWASNISNPSGFYAKTFGEGKYMVPIALLAAGVNYIDTDTAIGNWGANASRAYIVGLPAMWAMQWTTGAARPGESDTGSAWRPINIQDGHGVSGHSFVGAVPFLTIAAMNPDNAWVKYPAYLASAAAGWSRINDDAHFPSQVVLGWYMAWEAVDSVMVTNKKTKGFTIVPMAGIDGFGIVASTRW